MRIQKTDQDKIDDNSIIEEVRETFYKSTMQDINKKSKVYAKNDRNTMIQSSLDYKSNLSLSNKKLRVKKEMINTDRNSFRTINNMTRKDSQLNSHFNTSRKQHSNSIISSDPYSDPL